MKAVRSSKSVLFSIVLLCLFSESLWSGSYRYNGTDISMPANVTVVSGDYVEYEGLDTVQNSGNFSYASGSSGVLAAGEKISLYPGFKAYLGSEVWGLIDSNFNGISDYIEELDADGDGYFDALENVLGTSNNQGAVGYEVDVSGDGIYDQIIDASHGGTPSQFVVGSFDGYQDKIHSFYTAYGTYYGIAVSYGDGFLGTFFSSFDDWFYYNFTVIYAYFSLDGWRHSVKFYAEDGSKYALQGYNPGAGWFAMSNILTGDNTQWTLYSPDLYAYLYQIPLFVRLALIGQPEVADGGLSADSDTVTIQGQGQIDDETLTVELPDVLSIPVDSNIDWSDKKVFGDLTPWNIDLDGDGNSDVTLDPINNSGMVSIPIPGKTVEIEVKNGGVWVSMGRFRIGISANGSIELTLPSGITGGDGQVRLSFNPLRLDLTGHLPGPIGLEITESLEDDPNNLVLLVNDNFDEGLRESGDLKPDYSDEGINLSKDKDYIRINLSTEGLFQGTVSLVYKHASGTELVLLPSYGLKFYTGDGQTVLDDAVSFTVDLANPGTVPLANISSSGGVTLLAEGNVIGVEDYTLILKYTVNQNVLVVDELHLHTIDIDFYDTDGPGAIDDDDENDQIPHRWAMMVPLSGDENSSGSGEVRVKVEPSALATNIMLEWASSAPSNFGPLTLSSGYQIVNIDGTRYDIDGHLLQITWIPNNQVINGLNVDFVARIPRNPSEKIKLALWRIYDGTVPNVPYSKSAILEYLQDTWTEQGNVHFEIIQDWNLKSVPYDRNDDEALSDQNNYVEFDDINSGADNASADGNIYYVKKLLTHTGITVQVFSSVYIAEEAPTENGLQTTPLSILSHEVGHLLGLENDFHDVIERDEIMSSPQEFGTKKIRRVDWKGIQP